MLVTGATGCGKSTTLAAMIEHINETAFKHIVTIEDPIEYLYRDRKSAIDQREVGMDTDSFESRLRRVMRQDPDVILIGEMRDETTVRTALRRPRLVTLCFPRCIPWTRRRRSTGSWTSSRPPTISRLARCSRRRSRASSPNAWCRGSTAVAASPSRRS